MDEATIIKPTRRDGFASVALGTAHGFPGQRIAITGNFIRVIQIGNASANAVIRYSSDEPDGTALRSSYKHKREFNEVFVQNDSAAGTLILYYGTDVDLDYQESFVVNTGDNQVYPTTLTVAAAGTQVVFGITDVKTFLIFNPAGGNTINITRPDYVDTTHFYPLLAGKELIMELRESTAIYLKHTAAGNQDVHILEIS